MKKIEKVTEQRAASPTTRFSSDPERVCEAQQKGIANRELEASNTATILAALRLFQREYEYHDAVSIARAWPDHFTINDDPDDGVTPMPLSSIDIDELCELINVRGVVAAPVQDLDTTLLTDLYNELGRTIDDLDAGCSHCWGDEHPASKDDCQFCCSGKAIEELRVRVGRAMTPRAS